MTQQEITCRTLHSTDLPALMHYLHALGDNTRKRFAPHPYDEDSIRAFYQPQLRHTGYIAVHQPTQQIIAYFIAKRTLLAHDMPRLAAYGLCLNPVSDFTIAPSVEDEWQGKGVAGPLLQYVMNDIYRQGARRLVLWGGVQSDNMAAVKFYRKHGFVSLGEFEYQGMNTDMILELPAPAKAG